MSYAHLRAPGRTLKPSERLAIAARVRECAAQGLTVEQTARVLGLDQKLVSRIRLAQDRRKT